MTTSSTLTPGRQPPQGTQRRSVWQRVSFIIQLVLSLAVAGGVLAFLIWSGSKPPGEEGKRPPPPEELVQAAGPRSFRVRSDTPLDAKLQVGTVETAWLTAPVLPVTGNTLASLRPGTEDAKDSWQFATPDLLSAFTDWEKAVVDVQFQKNQLVAVRDLANYRVEA